MYITMRHYEGVVDTVETAREISEGFLPIIREVQGFVSYSMVDAGDSTLVTISVFEDQSGAEESNSFAAEWIQQHHLRSSSVLIPHLPQITAGEVVVHESS